jgi:hypothetical protein
VTLPLCSLERATRGRSVHSLNGPFANTYAVDLPQDPTWATFEPCGNPQGADLEIYAISGQELRANRPLA